MRVQGVSLRVQSKIISPASWQKIAKRSKKHAMKMAEDPEKKVKFDQKIRNKIRGRRNRRRTIVRSVHQMINFNH